MARQGCEQDTTRRRCLQAEATRFTCGSASQRESTRSPTRTYGTPFATPCGRVTLDDLVMLTAQHPTERCSRSACSTSKGMTQSSSMHRPYDPSSTDSSDEVTNEPSQAFGIIDANADAGELALTPGRHLNAPNRTHIYV